MRLTIFVCHICLFPFGKRRGEIGVDDLHENVMKERCGDFAAAAAFLDDADADEARIESGQGGKRPSMRRSRKASGAIRMAKVNDGVLKAIDSAKAVRDGLDSVIKAGDEIEEYFTKNRGIFGKMKSFAGFDSVGSWLKNWEKVGDLLEDAHEIAANLSAPDAKESAYMIFNWVYGKMSYELKNLGTFSKKLVEDGKKIEEGSDMFSFEKFNGDLDKSVTAFEEMVDKILK